MTWSIWSTMPLWLVYVVNALAVHRVSRLIARDTIFDRPRAAITDKFDGMLVNLILCMWCLSVWIAAVAILLTAWDTTRSTWLVIASGLAIADAAGLLSEYG